MKFLTTKSDILSESIWLNCSKIPYAFFMRINSSITFSWVSREPLTNILFPSLFFHLLFIFFYFLFLFFFKFIYLFIYFHLKDSTSINPQPSHKTGLKWTLWRIFFFFFVCFCSVPLYFFSLTTKIWHFTRINMKMHLNT